MRLHTAVLAALLAASLAGCAARDRPAVVPPAAAALQDLAGVDDLAARFDRDRAHPRIVLLLSPT
jgi:hypothetical protein